MKKSLLFLAIFGSCAAFAVDVSDSYLYWMIGEVSDKSDASRAINYNGIKIAAIDSNHGNIGYLNLGTIGESGFVSYGTQLDVSGSEMQSMKDGGAGYYAFLGTAGLSGTAYGYVIELYNDAALQGSSDVLYSSEAAQYIAELSGGTKFEPVDIAWGGGSFAVPEPNSALLMVLGCAALALRRRKMVKG